MSNENELPDLNVDENIAADDIEGFLKAADEKLAEVGNKPAKKSPSKVQAASKRASTKKVVVKKEPVVVETKETEAERIVRVRNLNVDDGVVVKSNRRNFIFDIRVPSSSKVYRFERRHPFQLVTDVDDLEFLLKQDGIEMSSPEEASAYYA